MDQQYWIKEGQGSWKKVSQEQFVFAERSAGFHPKPGCGPVATGGFTSGSRQIVGRVVGRSASLAGYTWDPEFHAVLKKDRASSKNKPRK